MMGEVGGGVSMGGGDNEAAKIDVRLKRRDQRAAGNAIPIFDWAKEERAVPLGARSIAPHPLISFLLSRSPTMGESHGREEQRGRGGSTDGNVEGRADPTRVGAPRRERRWIPASCWGGRRGARLWQQDDGVGSRGPHATWGFGEEGEP